jgi:hypothetical protein
VGIFADWPDNVDLMGDTEPLTAGEVASGVADRETFEQMRRAVGDFGGSPRLPGPDPHDGTGVAALRREMEL